MTFENKTAWITGGSSGIGLALAKDLARQGARVWLLARRVEILDAALENVRQAGKPGQPCGRAEVDVSEWEATRAVVGELLTESGPPHLLINSAGLVEPGMIVNLPLDAYRKMIDVDYYGTLHVVKAVLPAMIERRSGHIVNINSMAGYVSVLGYSAYSAAKFAQRAFTDALRMEMKPYGIGVSIVFPPDTDTPQLEYDNALKPPELKETASQNVKVMTPEAVSKAILDGLRKNYYMIFPGWESKWMFAAVGFLGPFAYPVIDLIFRRAMRLQARSQRG